MLTFYVYFASEIVIQVVAWVLTAYSLLVCIGHIVFQAVLATQHDYGRKWLPDGSTGAIVLQYVGFQRYVLHNLLHRVIFVGQFSRWSLY